MGMIQKAWEQLEPQAAPEAQEHLRAIFFQGAKAVLDAQVAASELPESECAKLYESLLDECALFSLLDVDAIH